MFNDIGGKLKLLAKIYFGFLTIASIIVGIAIFDDITFLYTSLPCLVLGPLFAWVSSLGLYAIGEAIDTLHTIADNTRRTATAGNGGNVKSQAQTQAEDERLRKLENLRAQGLISEEEFRQAVAKQQ